LVLTGVSVEFTWPLPVEASSGTQGHPNHFDPSLGTKSIDNLSALGMPKAAPGPPPYPGPPRIPKVPMPSALVPLDPVTGAHFLSGDGVLELKCQEER
jgi:hypothetical protein